MVAVRPRAARGHDAQPEFVARDEVPLSASAGVVARANNLDEKPSTFSTSTLAIALGVTIPAVIALGILLYLHRRNVKRQRMEDAGDPHSALDFGIDEGSGGKKKKKKGRASILMSSEKASHKNNQLSMDMNLESPYLLPPQVHGSHDSVHTLTRGYPSEFDPYRMVNSESGSIRSFNRDPSVHGGSSKRASIMTGRSGTAPPRQGSFPRPAPSDATLPPYPSEKTDFDSALPPIPPPPKSANRGLAELQSTPAPVTPVIPEIDSVPYDDEKPGAAVIPEIQELAPTVAKNPGDRLASPPPGALQPGMPGMAQSDNTDNIGVAHASDAYNPALPQGPAGLGLDLDLPQPLSPMGDMSFASQPGQAVSDNRESRGSVYYDDDETRGRSDMRDPPMETYEQSQGLGVPQQDARRLSIGMRPLPPDEVMESEDPEYRANRIRSFYKEYFEDSSKEAAPPMPHVPADYYGGAQYYEDYDQQYLGEAAYFDPDSNAFVMPGAEPVHRRAMTPPPGGRRGPPGPGRRGPPGARRPMGPHGPHGSVGGMSALGGGRMRAGSALGPRPGSSASAAFGRQTPKKNLPPPAALSTLPTPAKLKDDSFAIFNATDFAPPESFGDRAAGRSQSPLGERRAYSPKVPVASPLVTTYDELNVLPSPHLLRKSNTFTNLDFLPPKKIKDNDAMSDAGSIRSNRSAMSAAAQSAVRMGAGRVSRLPGDTVFTQHAMSTELKPQWGMRP